MRPLSEIVGRFLRSWRNAVGDQLLSRLPCQISIIPNLLELLKNALSPQSNVISCFLMLVDELQSLSTVPVVFLIDQCNAFYTKHTVQLFSDDERKVVEPGSGHNPIASLFVQWNIHHLVCVFIIFQLDAHSE